MARKLTGSPRTILTDSHESLIILRRVYCHFGDDINDPVLKEEETKHERLKISETLRRMQPMLRSLNKIMDRLQGVQEVGKVKTSNSKGESNESF